MKSRPRSVEREVAACLSGLFVSQGFAPVKRIPVLGRTGPDISINELGLIIDVKSRQSVPARMIVPQNSVIVCDKCQLNGMRLIEMLQNNKQNLTYIERPSSKTIISWWEHMDEWRRDNFPDGITALVLHRPGTWVQNSTFLFHESDKEKLYDRYTNRNSNFRIPAKLQSQLVGGAGWFAPGCS